mgnify:CR=1 FL=1
MKSAFTLILFAVAALSPSLIAGEDYDLWKKGRGYWYKNDWENAAKSFKTLIEKFPESPRRCKSENYLSYCYHKLDRRQEALEVLEKLIGENTCKQETLDDAKAKRLQLAFEMVEDEPAMKRILMDSLKDANLDIALSAAVWLSQLNDPAGIATFFRVLEKEDDQDRRNTASTHILKLGSDSDKTRLQTIIDDYKTKTANQSPKMIRLIIRDLKTHEETAKVNLPIGLYNVVIKSFSEEQLLQIKEEAGIDLRNLDMDLDQLPSGTVLFKIVDGKNQEIKLFLE